MIAPKVEVGVEAEIEPALLTDGDRIYFAWDFCRWHYPERNYNPKAHHKVKEEYLDQRLVSPADRGDLHHYCLREEFTIRAGDFTVINNDRVRLTLSDAAMTPIQVSSHAVPGGYIPGRIATTISRVTGEVKPKLLPAIENKQPYVFLMSRNSALLERVVLRTEVPKPTEQTHLLTRLEQYTKKRLATDPTAAGEQCGSYIPNLPSLRGWMAQTGMKLLLAEVFYADFNNDGFIDMLVRLVEKPRLNGMGRVYYGNGKELCTFRNRDGNRNSPIYRPLILLRTGICVYVFVQTSTEDAKDKTGNANLNLIPLDDKPEQCRMAESWRLYEMH